MNPIQASLEKPIAIHEASGSFSDAWCAYCDRHCIPYVRVNCYDTDIVAKVSGCSCLLWHWSHTDASAARFARQLTYSLEAKGIPVFPNSQTSWHFDDKLGQKYLFEALELPHVPSYAFYRERDALDFINKHSLPMVFKLSRGAGSKNVVLVKKQRQAKKLVRRSFGKGWQDRNRSYALKERLWHFRRDKDVKSAVNICKGIARFIHPHPRHKNKRVESAYVYFQDFVPNNDSDIRVVVIGAKAVAIRRMARKNDFRASGSGSVIYDPKAIPLECVKLALESANKIGMQSAAFDFVLRDGEPLVVEVSYGFNTETVNQWPGYWDQDLGWHEGAIVLEEWIIQEVLLALTEGAL